KEDNKTGTVTIEGNEGMMIFPYCQSSGGVCDPGFRSFPFETTRIYLEEMDSGTRVYSLEVSDNQQVRHFLWEESGESIRFKDQEYTLISGEAFPLEFITEKDLVAVF
ncbi:MAG: hypothetical protein EBZ49_06150, partial [Proteobacteria bacterium]|nr:hypothetical protein [Pseudomonadota bacterium]